MRRTGQALTSRAPKRTPPSLPWTVRKEASSARLVAARRHTEGESRRATYKSDGKQFKADTCTNVSRAAADGEITLVSLARGSYPGVRLEDKILTGVKSLGYWDAAAPQSWGLDWHRNEGIELTILANGTVPYSCDDRSYVLKPYDLTIARPWQPHRIGNPTMGANRLYFLILDVGVRKPNQDWEWPGWLLMNKVELEELTVFLRHNEFHVWADCRDFLHCFQEIGKAAAEYPSTRDVTYLSLKLNELFYLLLRLLRTRKVPLTESLTSNYRTVELFLADLPYLLAEEWTIARMARECNVCTTRFVQYCRAITNRSPMQHLGTLRLEKARSLLSEGDLPIIDISSQCGFSTSQYFASCFRRRYGMTPSDYRRT
jgi:AraC-like DNA-binding protein